MQTTMTKKNDYENNKNKVNNSEATDGRLNRKIHLNYINGVTLTMMNKIAKYEFGENFFSSYKDKLNKSFVMIVKDNTEEWQIKRFEQYWNVKVNYISSESAIRLKVRKENKPRNDKKQLNYIQGITLSVMNKIATYEFGSNFIKSYKDVTQHSFVFIVNEKTPDWQVKKFSEYWKVHVLHTSKRQTF